MLEINNVKKELFNMNKKKLKNYGLWISVASTALLVAQLSGFQIDDGKVMNVVNAILGTLVLAGIVSNPTSGKGYVDNE